VSSGMFDEDWPRYVLKMATGAGKTKVLSLLIAWSFFHKLYEMIVGGVANLLENKKTNDVATQADISGPVGSAKASAWQIIGRAFENAFKAILPGFEKQVERLRGRH